MAGRGLGVHEYRSGKLASVDMAFAHAGLPVIWLYPGGHHLTNVLFHIANALLLFLWLNKIPARCGAAHL